MLETGNIDMQIETLAARALRPYPRNARTHSKKQIRQIANSIERFGFNNPVLIDDEKQIIAGHGRVQAAKLLGIEEVPTVRLSHLSEVGRGLRRQSYDLNEDGLFDVEYADILGIPFDFTAKPVVVLPKRPKPTVRVHAVKDRAALEITFPRVEGYRVELPDEAHRGKIHQRFAPHPDAGRGRSLQSVAGRDCREGVELDTATLDTVRPSSISYHLAKHLLYTLSASQQIAPKGEAAARWKAGWPVITPMRPLRTPPFR
jgi:type III restriction enzyme